MAVLLTLDLAVSREDLEAVSDDMGVRDDPPPGLIAHVLTETASGVHVIDIWESEADFQTFAQDRLMPAIERVLKQRGVALEGPLPDPTFTPAYDLVRGR